MCVCLCVDAFVCVVLSKLIVILFMFVSCTRARRHHHVSAQHKHPYAEKYEQGVESASKMGILPDERRR